MPPVSRWTLGALLVLALIWVGPAKATTPLCTINGGSTYTDCVLPTIVWTAAANPLGANYYATPNDSAVAFGNEDTRMVSTPVNPVAPSTTFQLTEQSGSR